MAALLVEKEFAYGELSEYLEGSVRGIDGAYMFKSEREREITKKKKRSSL